MFNPTVVKRVNTIDWSIKSLTLIFINSSFLRIVMYVYTITTSWYYKDVSKKVGNKPINAHFLPIVRNRIRIGKNGW